MYINYLLHYHCHYIVIAIVVAIVVTLIIAITITIVIAITVVVGLAIVIVIVIVGTIFIFVVGTSTMPYIPRCMAGTLLLHIGIDLFLEGIVESFEEYDNIEYAGVSRL